jgi:phage I-like protein
MNLILNRDFKMPDDGWYQLAPLGEFPHVGAGVVQVVDAESCTSMVARFKADAAVPNFAGLLVDFDHCSLDDRARSEAAGWIVALEARAGSGKGQAVSAEGNPHPCPLPSQGEGGGLWGQIRWSDLGEAAVKGGRYRFLSPVWARSDCVDLGNGRVRPVRLLNAAVTNDPNLKGLRPLCNNGRDDRPQTTDCRQNGEPVDRCVSIGERHIGHGKDDLTMKRVIEKLTNHLGLPGDASEDVILEKMQGLPSLTVVVDLQNSLKQTQDERDAIKGTLKTVEGELVNRHMAEFEGVISEATKPFWTEQLMKNRDGALTALGDLAALRAAGKGETASGKREDAPQTKKPLHNRAASRPVIPGVGGEGPATGSGSADGQAVKIRNRAHEIAKAEKVPFTTAFRRAEREVLGSDQ